MERVFRGLVLFLFVFGLLTTSVGAQEIANAQNNGNPGNSNRPDPNENVDQIIIKLQSGTPGGGDQSNIPQHVLDRLAQVGGAALEHSRAMSGDAHVLKLPNKMPRQQVEALVRRLVGDDAVEYAEPDLILGPNLTPNDPGYSSQWHYDVAATITGAANLPAAWDISTGNSNVVVAVLDTGIISSHPDFSGRLIAGYDFISTTSVSNDGNGRDSNPEDPGDWCNGGSSSWHGTHVAGTIGAASNNSLGVAGVDWNAKIMPLRVLGTCGGYTSDIADAIRWSVGLSVAGVPANVNKAHVINMSLGGSAPTQQCGTTMQSAIDAATTFGATVVVAAGNDNEDAANHTPSVCNNVITVAAVGRDGQRASYSNYGSVVEIAAPGGSDGFFVYSTDNDGSTTQNNNTYAYKQGTSMATPHVAGIASLMLGANYSLTNSFLSPATISQKIQTAVRAFPTGTVRDCTTSICGSGLIDAALAVAAVTTAPVGNAGSDQNVGGSQTVNLGASVTDDSNGPYTYTWTQTAGNIVTLNNDDTASPSFTSGVTIETLTFEVTVTDDVGLSHTDSVDINVNGTNNAPTATAASPSTNEDVALNATLAGNDSDSDPLTFEVVTNPTQGIISGLDTNTGDYTYTPNQDYNGSDSFTFRVHDGWAYSAPATVSITITAINDAPVASNASISTAENATFTGTLSATDADGDGLTYSIVANGSNGTATVTNASTGAFNYVPDNAFTGSDTFTFKTNDSTVDSNTATVTVTVVANQVPVASNGSLATLINTSKSGTLVGTDAEAANLTYVLVSSAGSGTVTLNDPTTGAFTYTPNTNFVGSDSFTFRVNDGVWDSNVATVSISVDTSPKVSISASAPSPQIFSSNITMTADANGNGNYEYEFWMKGPGTKNSWQRMRAYSSSPNWVWNTLSKDIGTSTITVYARLSGGTNFANTSISYRIKAANNAPVASDGTLSVKEDTAQSGLLVASDVDGDVLTFAIVGAPSNGNVVINDTATGNFTYTPNASYVGGDTFTFNVNDGTTNSNTATMTVTVAANQAPVAAAGTLNVSQDVPASGTLVATDANGDTLVYSTVANPSNGSVNITNTATGAFTYTPDTGYSGADSFTFKANDGNADSNTATISVTVAPNQTPVASNGTVSLLKNTTKSGTLVATDPDGGNLTYSIVSSPSNGSLTIVDAANGSYRYTPNTNYVGNDSFTFRVNDGAANSNTATMSITIASAPQVTLASDVASPQLFGGNITLTAAANGGDNYHYEFWIKGPGSKYSWQRVQGYSSSATWLWSTTAKDVGLTTITVYARTVSGQVFANTSISYTTKGVNNLPVANDDSLAVKLNTPKSGLLIASDADGDAITFSIVSAPTDGSVTVDDPATGAYTYSPDTSFTGNDSFTFKVNDGAADSNTATISVNVAANQAPVANTGVLTVNEGVAKIGILTGSDADGDSLSYSIGSGASDGTVVIDNAVTGAYTYTPDPSFSGSDSFTFIASDGDDPSTPATINVTVIANQVPVASTQQFAVLANTSKPGTLVATDPDGGSLTYAIVGAPANGTLTLDNSATGQFTYEPDAGFVGADSFTFEANDGITDSNTATVTVSVGATPAVVVTPSVVSPQKNGKSVTFSAAANGGETYEYEFLLKGPGTKNSWKLVQAFSQDNTWVWSTTGKEIGVTEIWVTARTLRKVTFASTSTNFTVTATANWRTIELTENNANNATRPQVAFDGSGNAIAIWRQSDGVRDNIWANRYVDGNGWGTAELIETYDLGTALDPHIAVDSSGNAVAVWRHNDGNNIWANRYVVGSGWGTAELIENDDTDSALYPRVAIDGSGNAIAVWTQSDGARFNIWANRYVVGSGWGTATLIETDNASNATDPQIAVDPSGNAIVVWEQDDGTRFNIWANRYVVGSGWASAELIETDDTNGASEPEIAIDGSGNAIAVWNQNDGARFNILTNRYVVGSGWGTASLIETDDAGHAFKPQVAFDAGGNAVAVWEQNDGTRSNIWANRYVAGSGWGTAEQIESDNAGNASNPQIAVDSSGNALAVWHQNDATRDNVWANYYVAGGGWGTAELIEMDNAGEAIIPQVSFDTSGNAIAIWEQTDGTRYNIVTNRFD